MSMFCMQEPPYLMPMLYFPYQKVVYFNFIIIM